MCGMEEVGGGGQGGWGTKASSKSFADKLREKERWLHAWFFTGLSQISFSVVHFNGIPAHTSARLSPWMLPLKTLPLNSQLAWMFYAALWGRVAPWSCHGFYASKNWALSTFCLCNAPYVSLSFKCGFRQWREARDGWDEAPKQESKSFSAADDGRGHRARAQREKDLDIRVTRKHDTKLDRVRKNYAYLMVMFRFLVALVNFVVKCHKIALGEGAGKSVFPGLKSDTLALISSPSLSTSCLLLIAIRMTWVHTGDYLITRFLRVPINNATDAIIHVAIFINTFMRTAVKLWVIGQRQH